MTACVKPRQQVFEAMAIGAAGRSAAPAGAAEMTAAAASAAARAWRMPPGFMVAQRIRRRLEVPGLRCGDASDGGPQPAFASCAGGDGTVVWAGARCGGAPGALGG